MPTAPASTVALIFEAPLSSPAWELPEVPVPESTLHDVVLDLLKAILNAWAAREARAVWVARNLALRWDRAHPKVGVDPDLCVLAPRPAHPLALRSYKTWLPGRRPPPLAIEVVSANHPYKDYGEAPARYAASGVGELWVFDPLLAGPGAFGGPHLLQVWARDRLGRFRRAYSGPGPVRSRALGAFLVVTSGSDGERLLRVADDAEGRALWLTEAETERRAKEVEQREREAEREAKEAALRQVAQLEAELARLRRR